MQNLLIIKLGGSLLTLKKRTRSFNIANTKLLCKQIAKFYRQNKDNLKLILVNGNGSFGHQTVVKYGLKKGFLDDKSTFGYAKLLQDTAKVSRFLADHLLENKVPTVCLQTSNIFTTQNGGLGSNLRDSLGKIKISNLEILDSFLEKNLIPILCGDMVLDDQTGGSIISSDDIPILIANWAGETQKYKLLRIINLGSYDGVWDENKKVIPQIDQATFKKLKDKIFFNFKNIDVSGGMATKLEKFLELADMGFESMIASGVGKIDLEKMIFNKNPKIGTLIK